LRNCRLGPGYLRYSRLVVGSLDVGGKVNEWCYGFCFVKELLVSFLG